MIRISYKRLTFIMLGLLITVSLASAFAANISVPTTRLTNQARAITANDLRPAACSAIDLTAIIVCNGGICNGTNGNDLMLGSSSADSIRGKNGTDCIVGGDGDDDITGNNGGDVCIGGPGNDTFSKCTTEIQ